MDELRTLLLPWYLEIKALHLLLVAIWAFSTTVAYRNYILPAFRAVQAHPGDPARVARRNDYMERFDRGAILEHFAFPLVLVSGLFMVWLAGWNWQDLNWLSIKLVVVLVIFLPVELVDYYLSHFGGNKRRIRLAGNEQRYEQMMSIHWLFFRVTTPLVLVLIPLLIYLAVVKPL